MTAKMRWDEKGQGFKVFKKDSHTERILCLKCGKFMIVYNGNYFCGGYVQGDCDWALAHPARSKIDRLICDAIGIDYW